MMRIFAAFSARVVSIALLLFSTTTSSSGQTYVDQAADFDPPNPTNGATVTWKQGTADEVSGLIFGTNAFSSVQSAINEASFLSTVYIAAGIYHEGSRITINKDITLQGDGADVTFLSGSNAYAVAVITSGDDVIIEDISIVNGYSTDTSAAGIFVSGSLAMRDCVVTGNHATAANSSGGGLTASGDTAIENTVVSENSAARGGGIYLYSGNVLTITNCTIADNDADREGGGLNIAGGTVTISGSTISGNEGNLINSTTVDGGGGVAIGNGTVNILNSTVSGNSVLRTDGGGIWNDGVLTVLQSTITGNAAVGDGGGIANVDTLTVINSVVAGNSASNNEDIDGVYTKTGVNFVGDDNGFPGGSGTNLTYGGGETIADIIDTNLADNGGATLTHRPVGGSPLLDAADSSQATGAGLTTDQRGAARIFGSSVDIGSVEIAGPPLFVSSDPPSGTVGLDTLPAIEVVFDQPVFSGAGSVYLRRSDNHAILASSTEFDSDTATVTPDVPLPSGLTFYIEIESDAVVNLDAAAFAGISDPTALVFTVCFDQLYVDAAGDFTPPNPSFGDPVIWNGTSGSVGGLVFGVNAFSSIQDAIDTLCDSGTVHIAAGLYSEGTQIDVSRSVTLLGDGKGVTQISGANSHRVINIPWNFPELYHVTIRDLDIMSGLARTNGGAVSAASAGLTIDRVRFLNNVASNNGGAVFFDGFGGSLMINDSSFTDNTALDFGQGGAVCIASFGSDVTISDSLFETNYAGNGGGISFAGSGTAFVLRCSFYENNAIGVSATLGQRTAYGGGIFIGNNNASMLVQDSTYVGNFASVGNGGAIANIGATLSVVNSTVSDNGCLQGQVSQNAGRGAGIYNNGDLAVTHCTIIKNDTFSSSAPGRGVYIQDGSVTVANSIVAHNLQVGSERDILGAFIVNGVNFVGDLTGAIPSGPGTNLTFAADTITDLLDTNLADNGGTTLTHALVSGSRAIDAADNAEIPAGLVKDQRGANRIFDGVVDIGAVEFVPDPMFVSASPATNGPPVMPDVVIELTFDQDVFAGTGAVVLRDTGSFSIIPSTVAISNGTVTITPISPLAAGQAFFVEVGINALVNELDSPVAPILFPAALYYQVCFDDVYVNDNWTEADPGNIVSWSGSSGDVTGLVFGVNAFRMLTNAVAAACASGTVHIAPGYYYQANIRIGKDLRLVGDEVSETLVILSSGIPHAPIIRVETGAVVTIDRLGIETFVSVNSSGAAVVNDGTLTIRNSSMFDNDSGALNGGACLNNGTLNIINSTLTGNDAGRGAAIYNNGGDVTLVQSTVVFNDADLFGGGIFNSGGVVTLVNSIVADNYGASGSPEIDGAFTGNGVNFIGDLSGSTPSGSGTNLTFISTGAAPGDVLELSPYFYEGPTKVHALVNGSPAVAVGDNSLLPVGLETDQLGFPRILGGTVDLGALEFMAAEADDDGDKVPLLLELILGMDEEMADDDSPRNLGFYISTNGNAVITFGALDEAPPGSRLYVERALVLDPANFSVIYDIELPGQFEEWYGETQSVLGPGGTMIIDVDSPGTNAFYRLRAESRFLFFDD